MPGGRSIGRREACNDFSIGIELEGTDTMPYNDAQYEQLGSADRRAAARLIRR